MLSLIFRLADVFVGLVITVLIVYVVLSWLFAFEVVSRRNAFVTGIWDFTRRLTDPILQPFRRLIPPIAGVDLSVLIVLLLLQLIRDPLLPMLYAMVAGNGV
jgi:YggT family protein